MGDDVLVSSFSGMDVSDAPPPLPPAKTRKELLVLEYMQDTDGNHLDVHAQLEGFAAKMHEAGVDPADFRLIIGFDN